MNEDVLLAINQAKMHTLDEIKRLLTASQGSDLSLRTDISMVKTELTNNMKRHLRVMLNQVSALHGFVLAELPRGKQYIFYTFKDLLTRLNNIEEMLKKYEGFKLAIDNALLDGHQKHKEILDKLDKIAHDTDLSNTDTNSVGRQIKEIFQMAERISDAIGVIDRRLPGIDLNGDGLMRNMKSHFDSMSLKLDGLSSYGVLFNQIIDRLEAMMQKMSDASFPNNDNHMGATLPQHNTIIQSAPSPPLLPPVEYDL